MWTQTITGVRYFAFSSRLMAILVAVTLVSFARDAVGQSIRPTAPQKIASASDLFDAELEKERRNPTIVKGDNRDILNKLGSSVINVIRSDGIKYINSLPHNGRTEGAEEFIIFIVTSIDEAYLGKGMNKFTLDFLTNNAKNSIIAIARETQNAQLNEVVQLWKQFELEKKSEKELRQSEKELRQSEKELRQSEKELRQSEKELEEAKRLNEVAKRLNKALGGSAK